MSGFSIVLLIAFIAVFIWIKRDDKRKWETVFEAYGLQYEEVQLRLRHLKKNNIHCRLKNSLPGTSRRMGMGGSQPSTQAPLLLQVHKKEAEHAFRVLVDLNKNR